MKIPVLSLLEWIAVGVAVLIVGFMLWNFDPFHRRQHAERAAATAEVQGAIDSATASMTADVAADTGRIHHKAQEITDALDASTDMDGDLSIWSAGIDRVLDGSQRPSDQAERHPDQPGT
jgi:hypothetical protein